MITDIHGNALDPIWMAEFRGFFFGEGYLGIVSWGKTKFDIPKLAARAVISSRMDDAVILHELHSKLGGQIFTQLPSRAITSSSGKTYTCNPSVQWRATKAEDVSRICDILNMGLLPSKKRREIAIIREFLATVLPPGKRVPQEIYQKRYELHQQIKLLHKYEA